MHLISRNLKLPRYVNTSVEFLIFHTNSIPLSRFVLKAFTSVFQISIPSSVSEQDSEGSFVSYIISIKTSFSTIEVKRRYRHFTQLHQSLISRLPDTHLPPLPNKMRSSTALDTYNVTSDGTRFSLQQYLQALGSIPDVWKCSRFIDFMDCRHPVLGLQVQCTSLTDEVALYRVENKDLSEKLSTMHDMLNSVTLAMTDLQHKVAALEQHKPQRRISSPGSQNSISPTLTHSQILQAKGRACNTHVDGMQSPYRAVMKDDHHYSRDTPSPSAQTGIQSVIGPPRTGSGNFDSVSWNSGQQEMSQHVVDHRMTPPTMRSASGRQKASPLQAANVSPASLRGDDYTRHHSLPEPNTETELAIDENAFAKFFGLGVDTLISSTEATLQQIPETSPIGTEQGSVELQPQQLHLQSQQHQSEKVNRITSLINDTGSVSSAYLPLDVINSTIMSPSLLQFSGDILQVILPTTDQLLYRHNIEKYISKLVRKSLGAQLYQTGLTSLNCFLPDDPIALSVYLCRGLEHSWYIRLNEKLTRMSTGGSANTELAEDDDEKPETEVVDATNKSIPKSPPVDSSSSPPRPQQQTSTSTNHPIANVNVITDEVESILQCVMGNTTVNIRANMKIDLCFAAFLEEVDRSVGCNHLFKKSLTLVRAWWIYESPKYADGSFNPDVIPDTAICIMVCAVFNLYTNKISSPMHSLLLFLSEFSEFNWLVYALTIFGRVKRNLIEALPYSSFIKKNGSLFSAPIIQKYQKVLHGTSADLFDKVNNANDIANEMHSTTPKSAIFTLFERIEENENETNSTSENAEYVGSSEIKIYHPLEPNVNVVSETILPSNAEIFLKIMQGGATRMKDILTRSGSPGTTMTNDLREFFAVSLHRFESGWRPDMLNSSEDGKAGDVDSALIKTTKKSSASDTPLGGGTDASDQEYLNELGDDSLLVSVDFLSEKIKHCNFLLEAQVTEPVLQQMSKDILQERGPLPVGEIGKMLQEITSISTLSAYLKEKYGGLKKFLELFEEDFVISVDHPFNPHVFLRHMLLPDDIAAISGGSIPLHLSTKANKRRLSRRKRLTTQGSNSNDVGSSIPHYGNGPVERSTSLSNYERNNSVSSRNSYTSQQSYGHTASCSRSPTPPPQNTFYGYSSASGSYSPPDSSGGQIYIGNNLNHHLHQMSNSNANGNFSNNSYGDRRRASHINDGRVDRYISETEDAHKRSMNRKTIPNPNFHQNYYQNSSSPSFEHSGAMHTNSSQQNVAYVPYDGRSGYRAGGDRGRI